MRERFWEIDFLRGIAIVMMVFFHAVFDLSFFGLWPVNVFEPGWRIFAAVTASVFIVLSGISTTFSHSNLRRGARIFLFGMLATAVTWLYLGTGFVVFGILHFIGFSAIVSKPFLKLGKWNLLLAACVIVAGLQTYSMQFGFPWLVWLGLMPQGFVSVDYFPVLPWFGLFLTGIYAGTRFYPGRRTFRLPDLDNPASGFFRFLGRHSLLIYLLHQVIIVAVISALAGSPWP
jgi:uncharacterized membrane protein